MVFYNWKKIRKETNGNVGDIIAVLYILTYKKEPPINRKDRRFKYWTKSFYGESFLLNPESLLIQRNRYSDVEIAQYAGIASLRNYFDYQSKKDTTLDLLNFTGKQDILTKNRLLRVENGRIHFLFEEITKEELKWH
tara:strand:+ start:1484 stop:1894 length:411 start_codon:yes stop_codon:yes gene_type:complete